MIQKLQTLWEALPRTSVAERALTSATLEKNVHGPTVRGGGDGRGQGPLDRLRRTTLVRRGSQRAAAAAIVRMRSHQHGRARARAQTDGSTHARTHANYTTPHCTTAAGRRRVCVCFVYGALCARRCTSTY